MMKTTEKQSDTMQNDTRILHCGHTPSPHSSFSTGTAHTRDGREICWECALEEEKRDISKAQDWLCYLVGEKLTNWPGKELGVVTQRWTRRNNLAGTLTHIRATLFDGSRWWGTSPGDNMYCRIHRCSNPAA